MEIPGYEIREKLQGGELYDLYRGRRAADQRPVLLKVSRQSSPSTTVLELLDREQALLGELNIPAVPRVCELLRFDNQRCLVLEDRGATPLSALLAGGRLDIERFLRISIQLAAIIAELHRNEIIHQNLSPNCVLVHPDTFDVYLSDLHFATRYDQQRRPDGESLRDRSLAYISPEQTGRVNLAVDYRTDFYSLGVAFYEMLAGRLPFETSDPLELIHSHIARNPKEPSELRPEIPRQLSKLVMKLLAKTAESRYQSAVGLKEDLEICAREWASHSRITPFELGRRDVSDRFLVSRKLYGREREVEELTETFERICRGETAMAVVAGYSGIGKTSLIEELYKPLARQKGYFASGKFDQVVRNVPFGAPIRAFRGLVAQLLTESEERLSVWRARFSEALGANGGVLADVLPEIELIIGEQSPPRSLDPVETLNRFQLVFQKFAGVLAQPEHPLVLFLDDLQWADSATLSLLRPLLTSPDIQHLFIMGAYRDNEVDAKHPLLRTIVELKSAGAALQHIDLGPLGMEELTGLVQDTLHRNASDAEPLARLVLEKTAGNPFFVIQFLETLRQEGFLRFDYQQRRWNFRIDEIARAGMTDNVVELVTQKIQRLPWRAQEVIKLAACIGGEFDVQLVAEVGRETIDTTAADLRVASDEGLLVPGRSAPEAGAAGQPATAVAPIAASYAFVHDRVQQAAYALVPSEQKDTLHLSIGRLLRKAENAEDRLFDIVHHLNRGLELITEPDERTAVAHLDLSAGQKAKKSTAYQSALEYLSNGILLLDEPGHHELAMDLHFETAECQYLCGNFEAAEREFAFLLENAESKLERARVHSLRMVQYENMSRYGDAMAIAREGLELFGVSFPGSADEKQRALDDEVATIRELLGSRSIESLIDLPPLTDPEVQAVMSILTKIWAPAYISGDQPLTRWISATLVRLSLVHGNSEESAYGYVTHAITVGPILGDYRSAYDFGRLALRLTDRFKGSKLRAKVHQQFHAHVNLWRQQFESCVPFAREACRSGLESGDFTYAAYGAATESWAALFAAQDLSQFVREAEPNLALIKKLKFDSFADAQNLMMNWARALQGLTRSPVSLSDDGFDEDAYAARHRDNPFFTMFHSVAKLQLGYLFEDYDVAGRFSRRARAISHHLSGTIWPVLLDFWGGLSAAALYDGVTRDQQEAYLAEMSQAQASLSTLAENCPENFLCMSLLLSAEKERVCGRDLAAIELYEKALAYARQTGMLQQQGFANELCARFWLGRGQDKIAGVFLTDAREAYGLWGAAARVRALDLRYPHLIKTPLATRSSDRESLSLDVATVTKAARAISVEIELDELLHKLMQISLENAGAERGIFLREKGGELLVEAEGAVGRHASVRQSIRLEEAAGLSKAVVRYVRKTGESLVIADATADERFSSDRYIRRNKPKSILCVPIVHQGRSGGILYLENNLTTDAFTAERIEMMSILSATAAITLEKANLYEEMKQEVSRRQRAEERHRTLLEINNAIITNLALGDLLRAVSDALGSVTQFDGVALTIHEPDEDVLRIHALERRFESDYFVVGLGLSLTDSHAGWVFQNRRPLLRRDLGKEKTFSTEERLFSEGFRSMCTVPLMVHRQSVGTLTLGSLTRNQYSDDDADFLQEVANQVALAVANTKVYEQVKLEAASRRKAEETLREILNGTASVTGSEFFSALVRHLASAIEVRYAFVTECTDRTRTRLRTLAFWAGDKFADNTEYDVALTPCKGVAEGQVCHYAAELQQLFPGDTDLVALNAESYIGLPLVDSFEQTIGHLAVMDDKPLTDATAMMSVLRIFAARAASELQRQQAEEELRRALDQVEQLKNRLHAENLYLQEEIREQHNFEEIVGSSPALMYVLREADRVAPTDSTVVIYGETGTGKELVARAIHNRSARKDRPLVKLNCGAISAGLVESELFGHVKGAFTGAFDRHTGRFELAHGGTLFLDEIGELPLETQVKLLRVLQEGEFEPVGSSRTVKVDVRIIAATNRNLEQAVQEGRFRADLFYRLNVFPVTVPPLRERRGDISQLATFFLSRFAKKFGKQIKGVSQDTMKMLTEYSWPGNVRELQNLIERWVVLAQGPVIDMNREILPAAIPSASAFAPTPVPDVPAPVAPPVDPRQPSEPMSLEQIERNHILAVLEQSGWVIEGARGAAKALNLHPNTLRGRLKKLGIQRPPPPTR
jgi:predicted ATPase/transcriptional regulator with GAF, ATPase, and Fis domain